MQLMCDGHPQIVDSSNGLKVVLNKPEINSEPVLQGQEKHEICGVSYGSVVKDGGLYRMWYQAWPEGWDGTDVSTVCCVESDDGINWHRPEFGLMDYGGSKKNNLTNMPFHCPSVIIDPHAQVDKRFRAFGYVEPEKLDSRYPQKADRKGYFTAYSADGVDWKLESSQPFDPAADVMTTAWDTQNDCAVIVLKKLRKINGMIRRCFYLREWTHEGFSEPASILIPDELDDLNARIHGFNSADYYGLGLMPAGKMTVGFLWNFRHMLPLSGNCGDVGRVDISAVYRTERNGKWNHLPGRPDWMCASDMPAWARGAIYTAPCVIDEGDRQRLYFTGTLDGHGWCGADVKYEDWLKTVDEKGGFARIGVASWASGRIMGLKANHREWIHIKPETAKEPGGVRLNLKTGQAGKVRVGLLIGKPRQPVQGYSLEDSDEINGDFTDKQVSWGGKTNLPKLDDNQALVAVIELTDATLYGFSFVR